MTNNIRAHIDLTQIEEHDLRRMVEGAVTDAFLIMMEAGSGYPSMREQTLDAIREGVHEAFLAMMSTQENPVPSMRRDVLESIRRGVENVPPIGQNG